MHDSEFILVILEDREDRALWEPFFTRMQGIYTLVELRELTRVMTKLRERDESPSLIILSTRVYPSAFPAAVVTVRGYFPDAEFLLIGQAGDPPPPMGRLLADKVRHMMINPDDHDGADAERERFLFELSVGKLLKGIPLFMGDYLRPGAPIHEFAVTSSDQKEELIARFEDSIRGESAAYEMLRWKGSLLVDEMLENALYGAPRDTDSSPLYRKGERREISSGEQVTFRFGFDGETLALEMADSWGSLSPDVVLEHLARHQELRAENPEVGGRGLFIIWRLLDTLHIRIAPGRQTVIGGRINLSTVDRLSENRGFHISNCW